MHDAWGVRAGSANMTLAIVEQSHTGAEFRYRLHATGIPAGRVVTLVAWPVTQREPAEVLPGVTFNDTGLAVCAGRPGTCGDPQSPMTQLRFLSALLQESQSASVLFRRMVR